MKFNKIIEYSINKHLINWGLIICLMLFYLISIKLGYNQGVFFACFPIILISLSYSFKYPIWVFILLFTVNYFIMGINRYISVPASIVADILFILIFVSIIINSIKEKIDLNKVKNPLTLFCFLWALFCSIEAINPNIKGLVPWFTYVRPMAFYPLFTVIITALLIKKYRNIHWLLILWAIFTLMGAAKGYWQRNHGFDATELRWLYLGDGARTHLISTGIRFFSFFTDAGNFGSSMGFSMVVFSISGLFIKKRWLKILFFSAAIAGMYGMVISGTRGALAVPFAGYALFVILSKRWKLAITSMAILITSFLFLNFTNIGDSNRLVHRMRSAFDINDASLQVRLIHQRTMKQYMKDLPFGAGIGISQESVPANSHLATLAKLPKDSWFVKVWVYTGVVGLTFYILLLTATIIWGSYIILFKIKNEELRGILAGMLAGTFGMMASAYGNEIFTQFPNCILIYTCQALVFLAPYFDKELEKKKELKQITQA